MDERIQKALWGREVGCGEVYPFLLGKESGVAVRFPPQKKMNFSLEMVCFGALCAVYSVCVLARKMLNFHLKW